MPTLETILLHLTHYGYFLLLPLAIIEGPIVTIIAAFLASTGVLNVYIVYVISIIGDVVGDTIYYWIGRAGNRTIIPRYGKYIGVTEAKIEKAKAHYDAHLWKTLIIGKITQAPILLIILVAGVTKKDFKKFLFAIFIITLPKAFVFVLVGFYLGKFYVSIGHGLDVFVGIMSILFIVAYGAYLFKNRKKIPSEI